MPGLVGGKPYSVCECGKTYKRLQQGLLRAGNLIAFVSVALCYKPIRFCPAAQAMLQTGEVLPHCG